MNKIILLGNLTRDPELRYTNGENPLAVARFDLAVNRRIVRQGDESSDFFHCVAFGSQAEFVSKYFKKASRMLLTGRVQNNNYTNPKGEKVYGFQVMVDDVEFAERRSQSDNSTSLHGQNETPSVETDAPSDLEEDFTKIPEEVEDPFQMKMT